MCTVTIIRAGRTLRLVSARDEQHARPASLEPRVIALETGRVIAPIDPQGGGSWIGVSARGWAVTILNRNPPDRSRPAPGSPSRGRLVLAALEAGGTRGVVGAVERAAGLGTSHFRLLATDGQTLVDAQHDGRGLDCRVRELSERPEMFSSSGLGDEAVDPARRALFEQFFSHAPPSSWADLQDALHAHTWHDRAYESFRMLRTDAGTVSLSEARLDPERVLLRTKPRGHGPEGTWLELPREIP